MPDVYAPMTLKSPMSDRAHAARPFEKPWSLRYGGRCTEMNAMWKPHTKKPHVSSR